MAEAASALGAVISLAIAVEKKLVEDILHLLGAIKRLVKKKLNRGPIYKFLFSGRILQRISDVGTQLDRHLGVLQFALGLQAHHDVTRQFAQLRADVAGLAASLKTLGAFRAEAEALRRSVHATLLSGRAALPEPGRLLTIVEESVTRTVQRNEAGVVPEAGARSDATFLSREVGRLMRDLGAASGGTGPAAAGTEAGRLRLLMLVLGIPDGIPKPFICRLGNTLMRNPVFVRGYPGRCYEEATVLARLTSAAGQSPKAGVLLSDDALRRKIRAWLDAHVLSYEQVDALLLLQQRLRSGAAAPAPPQPTATPRPPALAVPGTPGRGGTGGGGLGPGALPRAHFLGSELGYVRESAQVSGHDLLHALGCIDSLVEENLRRGPIYQFIYSGRILQRISVVSTQLVLHLNVLQAALGVQANHDVSRRFGQLCAQVAGLDASLKTLLAYRADSEALRRSVKADLQSGSAALPEPGRLLSIVEESVTRSLRRAQAGAGAGARAEADVADRLLRNRGVAAPAQRPAARILAADDALQREIRAWLEDNAIAAAASRHSASGPPAGACGP
ncbi:hypothetical protein HYH03_012243 [Edaphochlamys debaryana]|uniref:Uncharacterized protein n=1 Tax=Edaphochlamys debaryana TaxID=47281 RepID=A0A836BU62_9CHLO|nr:hypothetical protein HYH03_012243 [Edaphochlamys debaryana]|eukprot:KAG2489221.1 hypothetical protein HYH03_012243 [Edaphochlamys debaryana]